MLDFLKKLLQPRSKVVKVDVTKRFQLVGRVGQGSMSKVWRAVDGNSGKTVALKLLDLNKTLRLESRFKGMKSKKPTEGEVAVQLKHPHIVQTFEQGITTKNEQFLVMEFVEGVSLSYLIDVQNDVMKQNRLRFVIELGEAIEYFHRQNWIHRDICPRNVLLDSEYSIKLIDFGLVVPNTAEFQAPGNRTGTANYMAPELIKRQKTDQRIDIFSFAVTAYEMYAKRLPWEAAETLDAIVQHINTPPDDIRVHAPDINPVVADTIMKGLAINPRDRWQTMGAMLAPLREALAQASAKSPGKSKPVVREAGSRTAKSEDVAPRKTVARDKKVAADLASPIDGIEIDEDATKENLRGAKSRDGDSRDGIDGIEIDEEATKENLRDAASRDDD
jgi:eukaryotic-like serine/threonine-protein kinase